MTDPTLTYRDGQNRPVVSVRYHHEDGAFWAEGGSWAGGADTLEDLRTVAREGIEFTFGGSYRSRCWFQWTDGTLGMDPVATEEFWPA